MIGLLLLTVFLFDHFSKESITSAAYSGGITGASHVAIGKNTDLNLFNIQFHNSFEIYQNSEKNQQDKKQLITETEDALKELYNPSPLR